MTTEHAFSTLFEVTLELRTKAPLSSGDLEAILRKLKASYPHAERFDNYDVAFVNGVGAAPRLLGVDFYQLRGEDPSDLVILRQNGVAFSRKSPYIGHAHLVAKTAQLYRAWHRQVLDHRIERIGFRSRNRIDIPSRIAETTSPYDFINIKPSFPFVTEKVGNFGITEQSRTPEGWALVLIATPTVSPLIDHAAILLDIDLGIDIDPPTKWPDIIALTDNLRQRRNDIFKACISDRARSLIT